MNIINSIDLEQLALDIKSWGREAGFSAVGFSDLDLSEHEQHLQAWLDKNFHGDMDYMQAHGSKRSRPAQLLEQTLSVISFRMDYLPADVATTKALKQSDTAYISRYALGRDYHKLIRKRLAKIAQQITTAAGGSHRAFVDSAPVLERALAEKSGLGWIAKNTMLLNSKAGSWFFLGEIYTSLALPVSPMPASNHCGSCQSCLDKCPTQAFAAPYELDARRCISYLTIENDGSIPQALRPLIGNRIYGCDDCQLVCPWTKFSPYTREADFQPRHQLDRRSLLELFLWTEEEFLRLTEGSAIRRIGYRRWLRNLAVGLGNGSASEAVIKALRERRNYPDAMVKEHIDWALTQLQQKNQSNSK